MDDQYKRDTISRLKALHLRRSEAEETIQEVTPQITALQTVVKTFGWEREMEQIAQEDDWARFPEKAKPKGQKIADLCVQYFRKNDNQPARLSDLYTYLTTHGIDVGGKNPNSTLSAHLSNSGCFEGDRSKGWRLKGHVMLEAALKDISQQSESKPE